MKKKNVNLKTLALGKTIVSNLNSIRIKGGDPFSRYTCGDVICIPTFELTMGCPGQSDNCSLDLCNSELCATRQSSCCPFSPESRQCPLSVEVC